MPEVFTSIFSSIEAFIYRCRNDADYTMEYMQGGVERLVGYSAEQMIGNRLLSWADIIHEDDLEYVVTEVDDAIARRDAWDIVYRVLHFDGTCIWIRERGCAVFEGDELVYLQGLIVSAASETELRAEREAILTKTRASNAEILGLSSQITTSVKELTILSINARIEAARSGDAGRGFAVIANEIQRLAEENGTWAQIISDKMKDGSSNAPVP